MNLTLGVAAHVDAGKTTLCEQLLRHAGVIRACGRVDHGDAFMDDDPMERARGITIFTEQATLAWPVSGDEPLLVTLMDTPGHVDFSGEMERALSVLAQHGIENCFDAMVFGPEIAHGKPAPDIFIKAREKSGEASADCLVLEDSEAGICAAYAAGIDVICVPDMKRPDGAFLSVAAAVLPSLLDVPLWLETH